MNRGLAVVLALMALAMGAGVVGGAVAGSRPAVELRAPQEREFKAKHDGTVQKYVVMLPKEYGSGAHDVLLAFHGHGSDRQQYVKAAQGECAGARDVAARHRMILVSPDYREPAGWMGAAAEADTVQLIGELKKTYKVRRFFLVGASMGGSAVLTFAALHPELVDGVSSQNGMANMLEYDAGGAEIQEAIKMAYGGRKDETPEQYKKRNRQEYEKRSAELHAEKFTMPLAITAGRKDGVVPPASVLRLGAAVKKKNNNVLVIERENGGHSTNFEDTVAALEFVINAAYVRHLREEAKDLNPDPDDNDETTPGARGAENGRTRRRNRRRPRSSTGGESGPVSEDRVKVPGRMSMEIVAPIPEVI